VFNINQNRRCPFESFIIFCKAKTGNWYREIDKKRGAQRSRRCHFESFSFLQGKNRKMVSRNRPASAKRNEAAVVISSHFPFCKAKTGKWYREIDKKREAQRSRGLGSRYIRLRRTLELPRVAATTASGGAGCSTSTKTAVVISSHFSFCKAKTGKWYRETDKKREAQRSRRCHFESFSFLKGKNRKMVSRNRPKSAKRNETAVVLSNLLSFFATQKQGNGIGKPIKKRGAQRNRGLGSRYVRLRQTLELTRVAATTGSGGAGCSTSTKTAVVISSLLSFFARQKQEIGIGKSTKSAERNETAGLVLDTFACGRHSN
jgi:hypothetical protein